MFYLTEYQQGHRERQLWVASNPKHNNTMNEADKDLEQSVVRRKRGDIREDGKVFVRYHGNAKRTEYWTTFDKFQNIINKGNENLKIWKDRNLDHYKTKTSEYSKIYFIKNKSKINQYHKNRRKKDNIYSLSQRTRSMISDSLRKEGYTKKSKTYEILGCSFEFLKKHLEIQFKDGMSWENRSDWHIDHIVPLSSAKSEAEIIFLNHYSNLQPLWAKDNIQKSNKMPNQETRDNQ